jgi:hypothetical protein
LQRRLASRLLSEWAMAKSHKVHVCALTAILLAWGSVASAASLTLAWDRATDGSVTGYEVLWGTQARLYSNVANAGNETTYTVTGLADGTAYYFAVRSVGSGGQRSAPSFEVSRRVGVPQATSGDFSGDHATEFTVFRPANGTWYSWQPGAFFNTLQWGLPGDIPVAGDYDGDGKSDRAVWRPASGNWYLRLSSNDGIWVVQFGLPGDVPVQGDYDGDGRSDAAVWRPWSGTWFFLYSTSNNWSLLQWGLPGDVTVQGDYDGDGRTDAAVWRPSNGNWYVRYASTDQATFRSPVITTATAAPTLRFSVRVKPTGTCGPPKPGPSGWSNGGCRTTFPCPATSMVTARPISRYSVRPKPTGTCGTRAAGLRCTSGVSSTTFRFRSDKSPSRNHQILLR